MSDGGNKEKLITFLAEEWASQKYLEKLRGRDLFVTRQDQYYKIYVANKQVVRKLVPVIECKQVEADTRILLHANHAAASRYDKAVIKSSDSDVEVISGALQHKIDARIYILSGTKQRMRIVDISEINNHFDPEVCDALLGLHAFTGCDSVSAFLGKGKKKGFEIIQKCPQVRQAMRSLGTSWEVDDDFLNACERLVCLLYGIDHNDVNGVRYQLFLTKGIQSHLLPPTRGAVYKHLLVANYQTGIWRKALEGLADIPAPHCHGWILKDGALTIDWMDEVPAPLSILELMSC